MVCFQPPSSLIGKVLTLVMPSLCGTLLTECSGDGQEARIVQIDFSAAFDKVNHHGDSLQACSVGVGGSVLSVLTLFLSNR